MEVTTIRRNGVFIIFPTKENAPIKENKPTPVINPALPLPIRQKIQKPEHHRHSVIHKTPQIKGNSCWHCGEPVWRNDVNYCWECYKYENFESK